MNSNNDWGLQVLLDLHQNILTSNAVERRSDVYRTTGAFAVHLTVSWIYCVNILWICAHSKNVPKAFLSECLGHIVEHISLNWMFASWTVSLGTCYLLIGRFVKLKYQFESPSRPSRRVILRDCLEILAEIASFIYSTADESGGAWGCDFQSDVFLNY